MRSTKEQVGFLEAAGGSHWLSYQAAFQIVGSTVYGNGWTGHELPVEVGEEPEPSTVKRDATERALIALLKSGKVPVTLRHAEGGEEIPIPASAWPDPDDWDGRRRTRTLEWGTTGYAKLRRGDRMFRRGEDTLWPFLSNAIAGYLQIERAALNKTVEGFRPGFRAASGFVTPDRSPQRFSPNALRAWYQEWVTSRCRAAGEIPSREGDWEAAKQALGKGVSREAVRQARREIAPPEWRKSGRRKGGKKKTGHE